MNCCTWIVQHDMGSCLSVQLSFIITVLVTWSIKLSFFCNLHYSSSKFSLKNTTIWLLLWQSTHLKRILVVIQNWRVTHITYNNVHIILKLIAKIHSPQILGIVLRELAWSLKSTFRAFSKWFWVSFDVLLV